MRDLDVRLALHETVLARHRDDPETIVIDEFGLNWGVVRVDVAVVNGTIHGYEIKSDSDTLDRLPVQAEMYGRVLDRVTLVAGRHLAAAERQVPDWWGLCEAIEVAPGQVRLRSVRRARSNRNLDLKAVAMLLWRDEALAILEEMGCAAGLRGKPRRALYGALVERLSSTQLRSRVRRALKRRGPAWRAGPPRT
ncbi:hypothetical protein Adeh_3620 [Anaeromyxobacter dehalogenans 2CP-C]|uniref:Phage-related protein n=1 Tax=Anaeromyxobacter dehalogenans (strain 2CP-C) TaxID=290397 RepID=Q2IFM5_ANADE|nr:sce7726 family protein [Anaeromyxobacter dehalogenans]ABC83386.1 hypothetical protein Adeh_3620 [Anaeromyxobacter dehalogenans 2CP-C]